MRLDGVILKHLTRFTVISTLCASSACTMSPAFAGVLAEHHSHEQDRDDGAPQWIRLN